MAAKAELERSEASLADASTRLNDLTIRAPFTGIVSQRYAEAGSFVSPLLTPRVIQRTLALSCC